MNSKLNQLHNLCLQYQDRDFKQRLTVLAEYFIGCTYGGWETGSRIDSLDDCKYDLDTLDCVTYAEVVLSLAKIRPTPDLQDFVMKFEKLLKKIHYARGESSFLHSNHFTCVDWIPNNSFVVTDVTTKLNPSALQAETVIDKLSWFQKQRKDAEASFWTQDIKGYLAPVVSRLPYIPLTDVIEHYAAYLNILPEYSLINIVRPNWNLVERIGTHLNVSHVGFAIKNSDRSKISFFNASSEHKQVVCEDFKTYLESLVASPTIKGINILAINSESYDGR